MNKWRWQDCYALVVINSAKRIQKSRRVDYATGGPRRPHACTLRGVSDRTAWVKRGATSGAASVICTSPVWLSKAATKTESAPQWWCLASKESSFVCRCSVSSCDANACSASFAVPPKRSNSAKQHAAMRWEKVDVAGMNKLPQR